MSIQTLEKDKIIAPFLGSPLSFIVGQDPLGLLNTGDRTYNLLLPGLNNVTERIRYYSFYAWFFNFYAQEITKKSKKEQFKYLRRAEFILALLAAKNNQQGIGGITKALEIYKPNTPKFILKYGTGEDKDHFENTYWKNPRGIFGQNYVSSLGQNQLAIIQEVEEDLGVFTRSDFNLESRISGKDLADAFEENIQTEASSTFKQAILKGEITQNELDILSKTVNLRKVPLKTKEHQLLWQLLINADKPNDNTPNFYRKTTIRHLLTFSIAKNKLIKDIDFSFIAYYIKGYINKTKDDTLFLWYYYQLEQLWHMISTGSFAFFLKLLETDSDGTWVEENQYINQIAKKITHNLIANKWATKNATFKNLSDSKNNEEELISLIKSQDAIGALTHSILLLKKITVVNRDLFPELEKTALENGLTAESNFLNSIKKLDQIADKPLAEFIQYFIKKHVIIRHQWVALKKMNQTQTTEKFIREDGLIRFVNTIHYGFSSPRLNTVIKFFEDLQLVDKDQKINTVGQELLNQLSE